MKIKQDAINKLANSMRIYGETSMQFKTLVNIDKEEAINNLDRAMESKLEAFHSLYDVTKDNINYFAHADTSVLIMLRNAIHHRNHLLFKSWNYEMSLNDGLKKYLGAEFLLAGHEIVDAVHTMRHYYKLEDFYFRIDPSLGSPYCDNRLNNKSKVTLLKQLNNDLNFKNITDYASQERYPIKQIYINIIPIFISAVSRVFKELKSQGIDFIGYDAKAYEDTFINDIFVDMNKINYTTVRMPYI